MNFLTYGDKSHKSILFIHGMATSALICYESILPYFKDYYVILAEVDGHSDNTGELTDLENCCDEIEEYVKDHLSGNLYCLSGFSMGGTMAVELAGRGNIVIEKLHLDAAFLTKMGLLTKPYEFIFCKAINFLKDGKHIPKFMMDSVMGKDNNSVVEMLYKDISLATIKTACEFVYKYHIPDNIGTFKGAVSFWRGENEKYPRKSSILLKKHLPNIIDEEIKNMGHGQYLHEHSKEYAQKLMDFLEQNTN